MSREQQACRLCTIVGPAGIGKTRIARELVAEAAEAATVAVGRCLSYGEAITYHPLIEIVRQLAGDDPDEGIAKLMGPGEESELVARRMRALVGLSDETAPAEETFWAVRKLFEAVAAERPLIVGFEDVHWAEPLLLDLIEYLVGFSDGNAATRGLPRAPGAARDPPVMGRRRREAIGRRLGGTVRDRRTEARGVAHLGRPGGARDRQDRADGRGQPAVSRAARRHRRGTRRDGGPSPEHPGRARRPDREPRPGGAHGARASLGRRPELQVELGGRASSRAGPGRARRPHDGARPQEADRAGSPATRRGGRVSVHSRAHPGGRLRGLAQRAVRGAPRALGPLVGDRLLAARTRSSATTSSRRTAVALSSGSSTPTGWSSPTRLRRGSRPPRRSCCFGAMPPARQTSSNGRRRSSRGTIRNGCLTAHAGGRAARGGPACGRRPGAHRGNRADEG